MDEPVILGLNVKTWQLDKYDNIQDLTIRKCGNKITYECLVNADKPRTEGPGQLHQQDQGSH